jgi:toxin FitB
VPGKLLLDSNITIYSAAGDSSVLDFIEEEGPVASAISYVETVGFHRITQEERVQLETFFEKAQLLPVDRPVIEQAALLRQQRRMSLGDSIVAATALVHDLTLVTRNVDDFRWAPGLRLLNPFDSPTP